MTRGALVSTVNSSGGFLPAPVASRKDWHPSSAKPAPTIAANAVVRNTWSLLAIYLPDDRLPVRMYLVRTHERVQKKKYHADRNGRIGDIENIPVVTEGMKVEKICNRPV